MSDKPIVSIEQFISRVKSDYNSWETKTYPWFRGEPDEPTTALLPNLYRDRNPNNTFLHDENQLVQFFRMKSPALFNNPIEIERDQTDKWLFLMQHFRLPTRLLDWTEGALIALFFALHEDNPLVWMLHPCRLNQLATGKEYPDNVFPITWGNTESPAVQNIQSAWQHNSTCNKLPIAIHPTNIHLRLSVQRSCFTVHGDLKEPLNECILSESNTDKLNSMLKCYAISNESKKDMLIELRMLGISYSTVYPDMEGISKELETSYYNIQS